jgi:acetate kinase
MQEAKPREPPLNGPPDERTVLTINGGSSSIRFALFQAGDRPERRLHGKVERIGQPGTTLTFGESAAGPAGSRTIESANHGSAARVLIDWLEEQDAFASVVVVGHRIVHGMSHTETERVTQELLDELHRIVPYDPEHLPREIELVEAFRERHPALLQVACFDTAFHRSMPRVARLLPIPRRFDAMGIERYGFHGLSYAYLLEELGRVAGSAAAEARVILAHLGNGASLAAVRGGHSVDTSMGFTPTGGLPMGTRSGDLDPGVLLSLMRTERLTAEKLSDMVNHESGLLGVSETSSDMRDLLGRQATDVRAAEAVEMFCYQTRKWIGAFAAVLGGLDTLVFAGGIGENAGEVRTRICSGLEFLGVELDEDQNRANVPVISGKSSRVTVRMLRTDEEVMIARASWRLLGDPDPGPRTPDAQRR